MRKKLKNAGRLFKLLPLWLKIVIISAITLLSMLIQQGILSEQFQIIIDFLNQLLNSN